jgi:hypothetical protein
MPGPLLQRWLDLDIVAKSDSLTAVITQAAPQQCRRLLCVRTIRFGGTRRQT